MRKSFDEFDKDKSGTISKSELFTMLLNVYPKIGGNEVEHIYGIIDEEPRWNNWHDGKPQWYYTYSYGLGCTSEGSILESKIIPYKIS